MSALNEPVGPLDRQIPDAEFVLMIDRLLQKEDPDRTIPWAAYPPPKWAQDFRPHTFLDVGCGRGAFTRSVLTRLAQWGCLENLKDILLVEKEPRIDHSGAESLDQHLTASTQAVLNELGVPAATVAARIAPLDLSPMGPQNRQTLPLLDELGKKLDLIILSHVTYYFGDGSGRELVETLLENYLSPNGRLWCVVRKQQCPIYEQRALVFEELRIADPKPYDYSEAFEQQILRDLPDGCILDAQDQSYLCLNDLAAPERFEAAYLLMWREYPGTIDTPLNRGARQAVSKAEPLFVERHFVLGRKCRGLGLE